MMHRSAARRRATWLLCVWTVAASSCVRFTREDPSEMGARAGDPRLGPIGTKALLQQLDPSSQSLEPSSQVAIRLVVESYPEFAVDLYASGLVRFVGGFGVRCHGILSRRVSVDEVEQLRVRLLSIFDSTASRFSDQGPSDVARVAIQVRQDDGWRRTKFYLLADHPDLYAALDEVHRTAGTRLPAHLIALEETRSPPPSDCNGSWFPK